jgi:hypothetical protein
MQSPFHDTFVNTIRSAARKLTGRARRAFLAEACRDYCHNNARTAERIFGWSRYTVQKGLDEQATGNIIPDQERSGRPSYSVQLPTLQDAIRSLVDPNTCTHPTFENTCRSTRMTGKAVLEALVREKGYKKSDLPAETTMRRLLGEMGYRLRRVPKTKPKKRFPRQTRFSTT